MSVDFAKTHIGYVVEGLKFNRIDFGIQQLGCQRNFWSLACLRIECDDSIRCFAPQRRQIKLPVLAWLTLPSNLHR